MLTELPNSIKTTQKIIDVNQVQNFTASVISIDTMDTKTPR